MGRVVLVVDAVVRCAMAVVAIQLARAWWGEPEVGTDGFPVELFAPVALVYAGWNLWMFVQNVRAVAAPDPVGSSLFAWIALLSLGRLLWIEPWRDEWGWYVADLRTALIVASVAMAAATFALGLVDAGRDVQDRAHDPALET